MSTNLSRLVEPFVTSVVVGKDVVPRVSVVNLGRLIDQMVRASCLSCTPEASRLGEEKSHNLGISPWDICIACCRVWFGPEVYSSWARSRMKATEAWDPGWTPRLCDFSSSSGYLPSQDCARHVGNACVVQLAYKAFMFFCKRALLFEDFGQLYWATDNSTLQQRRVCSL